MPKVSIIIPYYNAENDLKNCIDSILNQTYTDFELLLINSGSTDKSMEVAKECAVNDSRIRMIQRAHDDVASAKNQGLQFMKGDYVMFMKACDTIHPEVIEKMMNIMDNSDVEIVVSPTMTEKPYYEKALCDRQWKLDKTLIMHYILMDQIKSHLTAKLFKRTLFNAIKFQSEKPAEDLGIMYLLFDKANVIAYNNFEGYQCNVKDSNGKKKKVNLEKAVQKTKFYFDRYEFAKKYYHGLAEDTFVLAISYGISTGLKILNKKTENWKEEWKEIRTMLGKYVKEIDETQKLSKLEKKIANHIVGDSLVKCYIHTTFGSAKLIK